MHSSSLLAECIVGLGAADVPPEARLLSAASDSAVGAGVGLEAADAPAVDRPSGVFDPFDERFVVLVHFVIFIRCVFSSFRCCFLDVTRLSEGSEYLPHSTFGFNIE